MLWIVPASQRAQEARFPPRNLSPASKTATNHYHLNAKQGPEAGSLGSRRPPRVTAGEMLQSCMGYVPNKPHKIMNLSRQLTRWFVCFSPRLPAPFGVYPPRRPVLRDQILLLARNLLLLSRRHRLLHPRHHLLRGLVLLQNRSDLFERRVCAARHGDGHV